MGDSHESEGAVPPAADQDHFLYHETQQAALCGVHAINTLLQGPYFSEIDLAEASWPPPFRDLMLNGVSCVAAAAAGPGQALPRAPHVSKPIAVRR